MKVGIDQERCTGCGICVMHEEEVFFMFDKDNLAYVMEASQDENNEIAAAVVDGEPVYQGISGLVCVPKRLEESVILAHKNCPGECIIIGKFEEPEPNAG